MISSKNCTTRTHGLSPLALAATLPLRPRRPDRARCPSQPAPPPTDPRKDESLITVPNPRTSPLKSYWGHWSFVAPIARIAPRTLSLKHTIRAPIPAFNRWPRCDLAPAPPQARQGVLPKQHAPPPTDPRRHESLLTIPHPQTSPLKGYWRHWSFLSPMARIAPHSRHARCHSGL